MVHGWPWELQLQFCRALLAPAGGRTEQLAVVAACTARARGSPRRDGSFPRTRAWQNKKKSREWILAREKGGSRADWRRSGEAKICTARPTGFATWKDWGSFEGVVGLLFFFSLKKVLGV